MVVELLPQPNLASPGSSQTTDGLVRPGGLGDNRLDYDYADLT